MVNLDQPYRRARGHNGGMATYRHLIPLGLTDVEQAAAMDEVGRLYAELRDNGEDVEVGVSSSPDGDTFVFAFHDRPPGCAA